MKRTLWTLALSLSAGALLTSCATGTEPTTTTSPSASPSATVTFSPTAQPESTENIEDMMLPDKDTASTADAGATTAEDAGRAAEAIEEELKNLSEVTDAQVVLIGDTAAVALKFDSQYQGGLDERMCKIVKERVDGAISGVKVVEITEDEGIMDELKKLGDRLDPSADLTELRTELEGIIHRITGDNAA